MSDRGVTRRRALLGAAGLAAAGLGWRAAVKPLHGVPASMPQIVAREKDMPYRDFGKTGLKVSELGFGAWGIGGNSYGSADRTESLAALARAEELGCNFVDTAAVYGDSESVLGEFLADRRSRWVLSTKYSGQPAGITATLEDQLLRLGTDYVDFYMAHWLPRGDDAHILDELQSLKQSGKARFIGVSLYQASEVTHVADRTELDGVMLPLSLLDPYPFLASREKVQGKGLAVLIRSVLKEGFLAGKFTPETRFTDPNDQRSRMAAEEIETIVQQVEQFRFLEATAGSMAKAAISYPLSFPEVSTVVVGVTETWQAEENFGQVAGGRLAEDELKRISALQRQMGLKIRPSLRERLSALVS